MRNAAQLSKRANEKSYLNTSVFFPFIPERYDYVGKLLKPGEAPTNYSDEEDEGSQQETETKSESYDSEKKTDHNETASKSKSD